MRDDSLAFLRRLLEAPSPSGYERPAQDVVRDWVGSFADEVRTDVHGNVIAAVNPSGRPRVMLAGHCDQIGLMVQHIDDDGYLYVNQIGGHDITVLIGQNVVVWSKSGPVPGVMARKPIHLMKDDEDKKPDTTSGRYRHQQAGGARAVEIGDPITWVGMRYVAQQQPLPLSTTRRGKIIMEALRLSEQQPSAAILAVSTVQERSACAARSPVRFAVEPQVGIAVDVTFATDHPGADKKVCGDVSLNKGPAIHRGPNMNPVVVSRLIAAAQEKGIPYQLVGSARATGTDANVMQISRGGVATGLVSVPNRYMHSPVETVSLRDMQHAAELLAAFVLKVETDAEFIP